MFLSAALVLTLVAAEQPKVAEGQKAPDITLEAATKDGVKKMSLKELKGKNVVLFFYPKAMTPGCTKESCGFSESAKKFEALNTIVIGISTDKVDAQSKFIEKEKLVIPLFADPDKKATLAFAALNEQRGVAARYTYVIDKEGVIRKIYKMVTPAKHPEEVLEYIKENLAK